MGFVGLKTNKKEEKEIEELETLLRTMDPRQRIGNKSAAIKEAVRIAIFHLKNTYFYKQGLTKDQKKKTAIPETRYIQRIQGVDVDIDGKRKQK